MLAVLLLCALGAPSIVAANDGSQFSGPRGNETLLFVVIGERGHFSPMLNLAAYAHSLGYRVKFASHEASRRWVAQEHPTLADSPTFEFVPAADAFAPTEPAAEAEFRARWTSMDVVFQIDELTRQAHDMFSTLEPVVERWHSVGRMPDLTVVDAYSLGGSLLVRRFRMPHVINSPVFLSALASPLDYQPPQAILTGGGALPAGVTSRLSLALKSVGLELAQGVVNLVWCYRLNPVLRSIGLPAVWSPGELHRDTVLMVDSVLGFETPGLYSPRLQFVGPLLPPSLLSDEYRPDAHLSSDLKAWLDRHESVVYVSFGTVVLLESDVLAKAVAALSRHDVLWSMPTVQRDKLTVALPEAWYVADWLPQKHLLAHPSVKLFVSHCGMGGAQESIVHGVPLLCWPHFGDQPIVGMRVEHYGLGANFAPPAGQFDGADFAAKLEQSWLNSTVIANMRRLRDRMIRTGGVRRAAHVIRDALDFGVDHLIVAGESEQLWWERYLVLYSAAASVALVLWRLAVCGARWCGCWPSFMKSKRD